jgi:hypothetical protein
MTDVDRIAPPVPTEPPPAGRGVESGERRAPRERPPPKLRHEKLPVNDRKPETDHIDEYV